RGRVRLALRLVARIVAGGTATRQVGLLVAFTHPAIGDPARVLFALTAGAVFLAAHVAAILITWAFGRIAIGVRLRRVVLLTALRALPLTLVLLALILLTLTLLTLGVLVLVHEGHLHASRSQSGCRLGN